MQEGKIKLKSILILKGKVVLGVVADSKKIIL
jgi:hypothetical protein